MARSRRHSTALLVLLGTAALSSATHAERCGGTERWFVKVGTDPNASQVVVGQPVTMSVSGLNALPSLRDQVPSGDHRFRLPEEEKVYTVEGFLALFKNEDDTDYHLVITDASLKYTAGGPTSNGKETGTSFIAEIVDPNCVAGKQGSLTATSVFDAALQSARTKFEAQFPNGKGADEFQGIPVTVTGVAFYDRQHFQTGRAVNGIELHPVLDIVFNPGGPATPAPSAAELLANPGFESGPQGWTGTTSAVAEYEHEAAHSGQKMCWLGGYGQAGTETIAQTVAIPAGVGSATLSMWLNLESEETTTTNAYDVGKIQLRSTSGQVLRTLLTLSNLNETAGYLQKTFDVTAFAGRTVQVQFRMTEDAEKATSLILDDISLTTQ